MSLWEYKVITSGKGGFASPALLEKFLNDLGRDEWEIIHFQTPPDNFLAFTGLARRSTQRDWTLEDAAAAAAKAEAEKLRAEFEAKFRAASSNAPAPIAEESPAGFLEEKIAPDDGFRKPVDTSHDAEPEEEDAEEAKADEWDKIAAAEDDDLPTFFEAIKPHMRRNQRGPGMSVGVDYLAKKWDQSEDDLKGALLECGFVIPGDEDAKIEYLEYDGDLYWLNVNRRGELWINTKEKPRPVFRPVKASRVEVEQPPQKEKRPAKEETRDSGETTPEGESDKPEPGDRLAESGERIEEAAVAGPGTPGSRPEAAPAPLPSGTALLDRIRPLMRRNRRGPGASGSSSFLSRALRTNETELRAAFASLGFTVPSAPSDKPVYSEVGNEVWWLNVDSRGGLWINGRQKREGESFAAAGVAATAPLESAPGSAAPEAVPAPDVAPSVASAGDFSATAPEEAETPPPDLPREATPGETSASTEPAVAPEAAAPEAPPAMARAGEPAVGSVLAGIRPLLKETKPGTSAARVEEVAAELGRSVEELVAALVGIGLRAPEKPREKPVVVEHAGEVLWLTRTMKGEFWLNAKASKIAESDTEIEEDEEPAESSEGGEGEGEKKSARRPRTRARKAEPKEPSEEKVES